MSSNERQLQIQPEVLDKKQLSCEEKTQNTGTSVTAADVARDTILDVETTSKDGKGKEDDESSGGFGAFLKLWTWCTPIDIVLRTCGFLAAIGSGTTLPLMTIVFGKFVDEFNDYGKGTVSPEQLRRSISKNALYLVYLFIAKFFAVYIHTNCFTITAIRSVRRLRLEYVKAILRQDMAYFDTYTPGSVATRISNNANLIQNGLSEKVGTAVQGFAMLIAAFVVAFTQSWRLTLPVATSIPTAVTLVGITVVLDAKLEAKVLDIYSKAGGLVEETLGSIRVVTAFGAAGKLRKKYDEHLDAAKGYGVKKGPVLGVQYSSEFFIMYCAYSLAFWYGVKLITKGQIGSGGEILTVLFSVALGTSSLTMISPTIGDFTKAGAAANDVLKMIARVPAIDSMSQEGLKPEQVNGELELSGVSFSYPARPTIQVLNNVALKIPARKVTALVGASGSGKSTIVGLLERWYDPAEGIIQLDGHNIKDLNVVWLRSQIGLVQQEPVLFNDTIYNNIVHGLHGTEMDKYAEPEKRKLVREACIEANADEFIQTFPKGYDTVVGERGSLLSGGQRQRVAIARSIISNPPILLLDEATSALDPRAEAVVQAALDRVSRTRTTILIAHKLSTVKKADNIVVMNKGEVIEQGTHEGLLEAHGAYWNLVNAQSLSTIVDDDSSDTDPSVEDPKSTDLEKIATSKSARSHAVSEVVEETPDVSRKMSLFRCLVKIFYEQRRYWVYFTFGGIASVCGGGAFPAQAVLFSKIVTIFQLPLEMLKDRVNFWALMFLVLAIGVLFSYASVGFFLTVAAFHVSRFYRSEYFGAMLSQDIGFFDLPENSSGSLTARLSTDPQALQDLISSNIGLIVIVLVNLVSCTILALATQWKLALVALFGCLPPLFLSGFTRMRMEMKSQDRNAKMYLESARFAAEAVGAIRTVSSLTLESKVYDSYGERLRGPVSRSYKHTVISMIFFGLSDSIDQAAMALAFWYGGRLLTYGEFGAESFFVVFVAIIFGGHAAGFLFGFTLNTTKAHAAANQILHLRQQTAPINDSKGVPLAKDDSDVAIEFKDVSFHYPSRPNHPVLRKINLKIYRGQNVGLVGASGCGKTTIMALLERFYDISSGEILIHGQSISAIDVREYRESAGLVSQETTLYQGSVRENVALGVHSGPVTDDDIIAACKDANIHDFIQSLPDGYNTESGSRGLTFSGGQRQRLAVARALLRHPGFLFLDEATSALDTESERIVQAALETAKKGRTTIAVAHRLSTVQDCDAIFVLDAGRIVERGTHQELLRMKGRYYEMCQAQSLDREA
ncbi:multidrug-resistance transporter mdr5 [Ophidiomyces ophidiicola]|uniref:Multidrug-resistance transporter mdr5 n=1 Tax=Ophidiomyces ophidiicola TaxID=1387563 RepID=A0ACB8UQL1_9EURO|nr:multidrug-resistance transporter mdr5 [Ophidiomyces ophidiicola]KAI1953250.1 multidrug-resistance transporter mdr5 [Ophidiomyces ophidiicola]KAI2000426.1 multidrug-resistance transporter mdr5 [Ophidiomyces ophidiicola]KAI2031914.1 multidrug-resistance transporter mdr5 [Ophidiomyces ophidiicola]KAI2033479.1 multidrug-resistance transporter mdr5 [Ophidiomyces ophidiicola]